MSARVLPSDGEILSLWAGGMTQRSIAERYGVSKSSVHFACERANGRAFTSPYADKTFIRAGTVPVEHRDTKPVDAGLHVTDAYTVEPLEKDDVSDLLREWGAAC